LGLHFCVDGRSALQLARRFRADSWLVAAELPDMSGLDLVAMLGGRVMQAEVDPLLAGSRISLDRVGEGMRPAIFLVADSYRLEDEQQALVAGVAAYMVGPIAPDLVCGGRIPAAVAAGSEGA
jgi:CheY-like chemotaxis protein